MESDGDDRLDEGGAAVGVTGAEFAELFRRHYDGVISYARKLSRGNVDDARDAVSDAIAFAWERRERTLACDWLSLVRDRVRRLLMRERRRAERIATHVNLDALMGCGPGPDDLLSVAQLHELILVAIASLPRKQRQVAQLVVVGQLSPREVAERLRMDERNVKNRLAEARGIIASAIARDRQAARKAG